MQPLVHRFVLAAACAKTIALMYQRTNIIVDLAAHRFGAAQVAAHQASS